MASSVQHAGAGAGVLGSLDAARLALPLRVGTARCNAVGTLREQFKLSIFFAPLAD